MKRSLVDSNKTLSPIKTPDKDKHNLSYEFNKSRYTEVTIQTFDKDVPFIAIYKPDISIQRRRVQAATKIVASLLNMKKVRVISALNRVVALGPQQKAMRIKAIYLGCLFEKMAKLRKEKAIKGLVVNKIKKNNGLVSAKIVCKIQNSILSRNYKAALSELRRNRLINIIRELSDSKELAAELKRNREEILKRKEESFSEGFVENCRKLQKNMNRQSFMELLSQENFAAETKKEVKKFEQLRYSGLPKRKEPLENESVAAAISNIIQHYEGSLKEYENHCQKLQEQLAGFKDTQGIQQFKQTITEKDNTIRDFQAFVNELARLDTQLKKFTIENKFMADKLAFTLNVHDKKLEQRAKNVQGTNSKVLASRMYLTGVISILVKKNEQTEKQLKEYQSRQSEYESMKNESINSLEKEIANMKSHVEQEKARLLAFFEKKDNRSGLLDLKRKWRTTNDQLKSLVDYVASLHEQIEKLNHQKSQSSKSLQKMKAQQPKKFERERKTKDERELTKKMQLQQMEAQMMERQLHNKSKSLQKEKLDLTRKLQKEQSDISRIQKELESKTKELQMERLQASRKDQELQTSVGKLSRYIKKTVDCTNQGTPIQSPRIPELTDSLEPIIPQVQLLVDLVCRLKNGKENHQAEKRSIYDQSFVQSDVKVYKPEINMDEYQKEIAHRLFYHLQTELQAKKSEISKNRKSDTKSQDLTTITLISELKQKIEMLEQRLKTKSSADEVVSKSITQITELESTVKQLENAILELSAHNQTLILKVEQLKLYYQQQIEMINSQFKDTITFISNQYNEKIVGFASQQSSNARLISQKNEQIFSKQMQIQQDFNSLRTQIICTISENNFRNIDNLKPSQDSNILKLKITEIQTELSRKTHQKERAENRLKQTEQSLENQRQKVSGLQADLVRMQQQVDRSHSEADKLAMQTHDQVKKITKVLRALEQELDKKTSLVQNYQNKSTIQQKAIVKLESELYNSQQQLQESIRHSSMMQQRNMQLSGELNHLKNEFFSIQVEVQSSRNNKNYASSQLSSLHQEIKEKQGAINSILEQSKTNSTTLNHQLFEAREQLVHQARKFEEQLTVKSALINRLEHQLIEYQSTIRTLEQKCMFLQQGTRRVQQQTKHDSYDIKDREIELLRQQIATLQQFLADISHQYKQLQIKYHQQKLKFGGTPTEKLHNHQLEKSMEVIDKAIHELSENVPFSQEVKSLIYNNEKLQINIEELQQERLKLLEKTKKLPEREYVVQLVFNVLLGARGVSRQSTKANALWSQLMRINQQRGEVGELLDELQKFSVGQLANRQ